MGGAHYGDVAQVDGRDLIDAESFSGNAWRWLAFPLRMVVNSRECGNRAL